MGIPVDKPVRLLFNYRYIMHLAVEIMTCAKHKVGIWSTLRASVLFTVKSVQIHDNNSWRHVRMLFMLLHHPKDSDFRHAKNKPYPLVLVSHQDNFSHIPLRNVRSPNCTIQKTLSHQLYHGGRF